MVWNTRCSARPRRRLRRRAVAVRHGAANEDVWRSPGSVAIVYARSKGGALVYGLRSRVVLWRTLGMVAGGLGAVRACGPGVGKVRAVDKEWRWTVGCLPDMLARLASPPSFLSTWG